MRIDLTLDSAAALRMLGEQIEGVRQPFLGASGTRVLGAIRGAIAEEFSRGAERTDSGFRPWPRTKAWGSRPATTPPLGGAGGRVAKAWAGGSGGFYSINGTEITIGVRAPWAAVHRGDNGPYTVIRAKSGQKMRFFHGGVFGVWLSQERLREGLRIPARPHATANKSLAAIISEALLGSK